MRYQKQMWPVKDGLPHNNRGYVVIAKDGDTARERAMRCVAMFSKRLLASINNTALHIVLNNYASMMHSYVSVAMIIDNAQCNASKASRLHLC
jgi:hypothetical protein